MAGLLSGFETNDSPLPKHLGFQEGLTSRPTAHRRVSCVSCAFPVNLGHTHLSVITQHGSHVLACAMSPALPAFPVPTTIRAVALRDPDSAARGLRLPGSRSQGHVAGRRDLNLEARLGAPAVHVPLFFEILWPRVSYSHENPPAKCTWKSPPHPDRLWSPSCPGLGPGAVGRNVPGGLRGPAAPAPPLPLPWSRVPGPADTAGLLLAWPCCPLQHLDSSLVTLRRLQLRRGCALVCTPHLHLPPTPRHPYPPP